MQNLLRQLPDDRFRQASNRGRQRQVGFREPSERVLRRPDQGYRSSDTNSPGVVSNHIVEGVAPRRTTYKEQFYTCAISSPPTSRHVRMKSRHITMLLPAEVARSEENRLKAAQPEPENPPNRNNSSRPDTSGESSSLGKE